MANRYWVGGAGSWTDTARWSTTSGGAGGASVPGSSDDVYFDANSGSGAVTTNNNMLVGTLSLTGFAGTFNSTVGDRFYVSSGNVTLAPISGLQNIRLYVITTSTITTNNASVNYLYLDGNISVVGDLTVSDVIAIAGSCNFGSYNFSANQVAVNGTLTATGGTWTVTGGWFANTSSGSPWPINVVFSGTQFKGGGASYNSVQLNASCTITSGFTAAQLTTTATTSKTFSFTNGVSITATNAFLSGTSTVRHTIRETNGSGSFTVSSSSAKTVLNLAIQNCTATGTTWICQNGSDDSGNSGWLFYNSSGALALF